MKHPERQRQGLQIVYSSDSSFQLQFSPERYAGDRSRGSSRTGSDFGYERKDFLKKLKSYGRLFSLALMASLMLLIVGCSADDTVD